MKEIFPDFKADVVYDVCHNIAKFEVHNIDGKRKRGFSNEKRSNPVFWSWEKEIQKIIEMLVSRSSSRVSMGTASYVLVGTKKAEELSFGSTAHGAGRVMSRHSALRQFSGEKIKQDLAKKNIEIKAGSWESIAEEGPEVYKDIDEVVSVSHKAGIGNLVAKMKPVGVIKG